MNGLNTGDLLESIAQVTCNTDREMLQVSLASTLFGLLDCGRIEFYNVLHKPEGASLEAVIAIDRDDGVIHESGEDAVTAVAALPGAARCLMDRRPVSSTLAGGRLLSLYPISSVHHEVAGMLALYGEEAPGAEDRRFIAGFLEIYRNYLRLMDESERDALTRLLNRRTFNRDLERMLAEQVPGADEAVPDDHPERRRAADQQGNWLAVMDIDFFKRVNDRYGHLYGDEVLLLFANIMRDAFRSYDKLFRFGGEEFVVLLKATDVAGARAVLERFRQTIADYEFPQIGQVTVSIGFVAIEQGVIPAEVLGHADEALYYAKGHGRNRVCYYQQLVETGEIRRAAPPSSEVELF